MRILEEELSIELIVLLVERAACDKNPDSHTFLPIDLTNECVKQAKFSIFAVQLLRRAKICLRI
jgi:hypothetical protein